MGINIKAKKKKGVKQPITLTSAQINKIKEESIWRAMIMFLATAMDECGWTEKEIEDFSVRLHRYMDAVNDHTITINTVSRILEQEIGIKIYMN